MHDQLADQKKCRLFNVIDDLKREDLRLKQVSLSQQLRLHVYSINFWSGAQNQLQYVAIMTLSLSVMNSLIGQKTRD